MPKLFIPINRQVVRRFGCLHDFLRTWFIRSAAFAIALPLILAIPSILTASEVPGADVALESLPGTKPLIKKTYRPPNYESPKSYFDQIFTPNNRFFVRNHLASIPKIDLEKWRLKVGGDAAKKKVSFSLSELKSRFKQVEIAALAYCSGNRRGLVEPHVPGVQWGNGAMGNALWKGVRLKDILDEAGVKREAVEVVFDGADQPVIDKTPDFKKSLPLEKALGDEILIAFEMNGKPLPPHQGFPARLVVPGWTATYWVKQLVSVEVVSKPFDGFWMKTAYRIPNGKFPAVETKWPTQRSDVNTPITEIAVNSLVSNIEEGQTLKKSGTTTVKGLAWDGGHGIDRVELSIDEGKSWRRSNLGENYGNYSWRQFTGRIHFDHSGDFVLMARATNATGDIQPDTLTSNPGGYHNNKIQKITVHVQ